jgi:phage tail sheath protein FI
MTGFAERGPHGIAEDVTSLQDYIDLYGDRTTIGAMLYDAVDTYFSEGGNLLYVSRVVGPTPTKGFLNLMDRAGTPLQTLKVEARYVGAYSTRVKVQVLDGTPANSFTLVVLYDDIEVERYADLLTPAAAVTATATSNYVVVTNLASASVAPANNPAVLSATVLSAGTDDNASATETQWTNAVAFFDKGLGVGQVMAPGRTTLAAHQALIAHAKAHNRTAYLDVPDQASRATLLAAADAIDQQVGAEFAGLFGSWVLIPGLTPTTTRTAPGSAFAAGLTARRDFEAGTAAKAPAGDQGQAEFAIDVRLPSPAFTEADYDALNEAGVNMTQVIRGRGVQLYGFRSVTSDDQWMFLNYNRVRTSLVHRFTDKLQAFTFDTIDGQGKIFIELEAVLGAELMNDWELDALYGESPEDAYFVDTGEGINTPQTIQAGELRAQVYARFSPFAEFVRLDIVKVPITDAVPGGIA